MICELKERQTLKNRGSLHSLNEKLSHPGGDAKHGGGAQVVRLLLIIGIVITQLIGAPLYWINKTLYYAYMGMTKESFGIFVTTLTHWWAPTIVRISGDSSVAGQLQKTKDGRVELLFPERLVMIANHQLYSDWLYLWWAAYTNHPKMHGHIYIILKESLKHIPVIGWGMRFYGFIFMSRKLATDEPRISYRLRKLKEMRNSPFSNTKSPTPMWLLLFPEGTNASKSGREKSLAWSQNLGIKDLMHTLHPRSSGSFLCLNELKDTVEYIYDCTLAYEGVKRNEFGQDTYTLRSMFLLGQPPPSVNMYWRRFEISKIPLHDKEKFELWLRERWLEKDALLEHYITEGRFPLIPDHLKLSSTGVTERNGFIETEVRTAYFWEVCYIFLVLTTLILIIDLLVKGWNLLP